MKDFKVIDLTHTLHPDVPSFDGGCGFQLSVSWDYKDSTEPNLFRVQKIEIRAGMGTHMDAPAHVIPGGKTIEALELDDLVTDCVVIRTDHETAEDYVIMPDVVEAFEKEHGMIAPNTFVIFYTGWERFWDTPEKYNNNHKAPSVHVTTAELLLKRNIAGIGIDTLSADSGANDFPVHRVVLGAGKYLVENIANAKLLPPTGAKSLVLPMKINDGTEAPVRMVAII